MCFTEWRKVLRAIGGPFLGDQVLWTGCLYWSWLLPYLHSFLGFPYLKPQWMARAKWSAVWTTSIWFSQWWQPIWQGCATTCLRPNSSTQNKPFNQSSKDSKFHIQTFTKKQLLSTNQLKAGGTKVTSISSQIMMICQKWVCWCNCTKIVRVRSKKSCFVCTL